MRNKILFACLASMLTVSAQTVTVSAPQQLLRGVETSVYNPKISPDGTQIVFNTDVNHGLKVYSLTDGVTSTIEKGDEMVLGVNYAPNGAVAYQTACYTGAKLMRTDKTYGNAEAQRVAVEVSGSTLQVTVDGKVSTYSPVDCYAGYLSASVSPNGKFILFQAAGKGAFVCDLKGRIVASLGKYELPAWCGNDYVVVQNATDDGHQYHSSQVLMIKADGSETIELTKPVSMTFNPSASADGSKVVYNTIDGRLFLLNITIEK